MTSIFFKTSHRIILSKFCPVSTAPSLSGEMGGRKSLVGIGLFYFIRSTRREGKEEKVFIFLKGAFLFLFFCSLASFRSLYSLGLKIINR
jgi:hypothetical protein